MFIINTFPLPPTDFLMAPSFRNSFANSSEKKAPAFTTRYKFSLFFKNCPSSVPLQRETQIPKFIRVHFPVYTTGEKKGEKGELH